MKLILDKKQINLSADLFMRRAGYAFFRDRNTGKESYSRRLGSGFYPKFHVYLDEVRDAQGERMVIDLHLDQKHVSYEGASHMHNADYDGEAVEGEIERLRQFAVYLVRTEEEAPAKNRSWWKFWA